MGYIKKLKSNELVGGTDKTTVYPVTSAEAVFEEVSDNEFKSQKYLNNHITNERIVDNTIENDKLKDDTIDMGKLNTQLKTIIQNAYDASWKVKEEPFSLETKYDSNDVVYDPDTNSSYVSLTADNQGNPVNPEDEGYVEGKWRVVINGISAIESTEVIDAKVTELETRVDNKIEELDTEVDNKIDNAQEQLDAKIADVQVQLDAVTKEATDAALEARDAASTVETLTSQQVADAQVGYFTCTDTAASGAAGNETKITTTATIGTSTYTKVVGSHVKIKMAVANTHAAPVYLQFGDQTNTKAPLLYNGEAVSASNSWEEGEVISVYFDGTNYQASNAQGGGGNIKSSKYEQIPVSWVSGHYINASNNLVASSDYRAAQNVDISGYKKIIASIKIQAGSAAMYVILDENYTVLKAEARTLPQIDLANYPTAKYMSFTNQGYTYSGIIYGLKQEDISIQDSFADYLEFGTSEENYIRSVGKEILILPKINTGITISTSNTTTLKFANGKSTEFGVIPIGATKIYYTGRSYGSIAGVLFYDKYKNLISSVSGGSDAYVTDKEFSIPSGTVYYRCSSMQSKLSYYFDSMPEIVLGGESGSITTLQEMPISLTYGGYINASNSIVSNDECYYAKDIDISEYSGKKLVIMCNASLSPSRNILLDEGYNILLSYQGISESVDLAKYPTAKYLSVTNNVSFGAIKYSGKIFVVNEAEETETEILNNYYEVYGSGTPAYAKTITDRYYIEPKADVVGYYISNKGILVSYSSARYTSEYYLIPSVATKIYYTGASYGSAAGVLFYDKYKNIIKAVAVSSTTTPVANAEVSIPNGAIYYRLSSMNSACSAHFDNPTIPVGGSGGNNDLSNYLYMKKYVALGDSFTDNIGTEVIEEGPLAGMSKVYPYIIANRNNMNVLNQGASGTVLTGYIAQGRYNNIPQDVDYITIWYGINDSQYNIDVGTVDDEPETITDARGTTTCGGYNWILRWLLTNRPYAHVGVIISDYMSEERRAAIIACCQKWGYPYLDAIGDPTLPMLPGGRTSNISVCADAITLRENAFNRNAHVDIHPSNTLHEWQSYMIESFMRRI